MTASGLYFSNGTRRNHDVRQASPGFVANSLEHVFGMRTDNDVATERFCTRKSLRQRINRDDFCGACQATNHNMQQPHWTDAVDDHRIAQTDTCRTDAVDDARTWLEQCGFRVTDAVGQRNHVTLENERAGNQDVRGVRPMTINPEGRVLAAVVRLADDAGVASSAAGIGNDTDARAHGVSADVGSGLLDHAHELVTQDD